MASLYQPTANKVRSRKREGAPSCAVGIRWSSRTVSSSCGAMACTIYQRTPIIWLASNPRCHSGVLANICRADPGAEEPTVIFRWDNPCTVDGPTVSELSPAGAKSVCG